MRKETATRLAALSALGFAAAFMIAAPSARAQQPVSAKVQEPAVPANAQTPAAVPPQQSQEETAEMGEAEEFVYKPLQVGDATQGLLAWQRGGEIASATTRPIAGTVANRSYERYLKSFEFPIPERMISTVKTSSGSGSSGNAPR